METIAFPASTQPASPVSPERGVVSHLQRSELFREYVKAYETTTGLPLALRPAGTFVSPLHASKNVNPFCALMAASNKTCAACLRVQQKIETDAAASTATFECFAGFVESASPIRVGDKVLGHLQTGQVLLRRPTPTRFARILSQLGELGASVDTDKLRETYFHTRVLARRQYDSMVRLLDVFAQHLASLSNQVMVQKATAESPSITRARAYIAEHLAEEIALADVARAVGMSAFYFCKMFKKDTGLTFTDYVARLRTETVKQMLLNPHMRVSEAAYAAGFQSLSQFNRVFRRIAGESPSTYRDRLHGTTQPGATRAFPHAA